MTGSSLTLVQLELSGFSPVAIGWRQIVNWRLRNRNQFRYDCGWFRNRQRFLSDYLFVAGSSSLRDASVSNPTVTHAYFGRHFAEPQ